MARELSIKGTFDGTQLNKGLKNTNKVLKEIDSTADQTGKSLGEMLKDKNSTTNYKRQLRTLQKQLEDMVITYRKLNDAEKNSTFGTELNKKIQSMTQELAFLRDSIGDVRDAINFQSSDTLMFDTIGDAMEIVNAGMSTFAGVMGLSGKTVESYTRALTVMQTCMSATNAITLTMQKLQKNENIMMAVGKVQMAAKAKATDLATAATTRATIAQRLFNKVAAMNPYVLIASAAVAGAAALGTLIAVFSRLTSEQRQSRKEQGEWDDAMENSRKEAAILVVKFNQLSTEFANAKKSGEDMDAWVSSNASRFTELGLAVTTAAQAEDVFSRKMEDVLSGIQQYHKAESAIDQLAVEYGNRISEVQEEANEKTNKHIREVNKIPDAWRNAGIGVNDYVKEMARNEGGAELGYYNFTLTNEGKSKLYKYYYDLGMESNRKWLEGWQKRNDTANAVLENAKSKIKIDDSDVKAATGSVADLNDRISRLREAQSKKSTSSSEWKVYEDLIKELQDKVDAITGAQTKFAKGTLGWYEGQVSKLQEQQKKMTNPADYKKISDQIRKYNDAIDNITKPLDGSINDYRNRVSKLQSLQADAVTDSEYAAYQKQIDELEDIIRKKTTIVKSLEDIQEDLNKAMEAPSVGLLTNAQSIESQISIYENYLSALYESVDGVSELTDKQKDEVKAVNEKIKSLRTLLDLEEKATELADYHAVAPTAPTITDLATKSLTEEVSFDTDTKKLDEAGKKFDECAASIEDMQEQYDILMKKDMSTLSAGDIKFIADYDEATGNLITFRNQYNAVMDEINRKATIEFKFDSFKTVVSSMDSVVGSIDSAVTGFADLADEMERINEDADMSDARKGWEKFMVTFDACMQVLQSGITIIEAVNSVMEISKVISELVAAGKAKELAVTTASTVAEKSNASASIANSMAKTTETAATTASASAKGVEATMGGAAAVSSVPIVGPALAIAAVASIVALLLAAKSKFATGGIVGGGSYVGDNQLIRVNSGEMVLNSRQQANLFRLLDGSYTSANNGTMDGTDVVFHISGENLVGTINNYNKRRGRI